MTDKVKRKLGGKLPVHLRAAAGFLTVRERIWAAIRAQRKGFTRADIAFAAKASDGSVRSYVIQLHAAGILRSLDAHHSQTQYRFTWMRYELARDTGVEAPRLRIDGTQATGGQVRDAMWQAVRILPGFDARDVALAASMAGKPVPVCSAKDFLLQLARGGYVVRVKRGGSNAAMSRYRIVPSMNTGPRAPIWQRRGAIFDANLGTIVWSRQPEARA